jgi:hypothetical protein
MKTNVQMTPEQIQMMVDLLPVAQSLRDISRIMDVPQQTLRTAAQPFVAILRMQGALAPCGCGKERFHPYGCAIATAKAPAPGVSADRLPEVLQRRAIILAEIMTGDRFKDIEQRLGMAPKSVRKFLRHLTPEQRAARTQMQQERKPAPRTRKSASPQKTPPPPEPGRAARVPVGRAFPFAAAHARRQPFVQEFRL